MKRQLILLLLIVYCALSNAQKIQFKDGKVFLDDSAILRYEKTPMVDDYTFYSLKTSDEVLNLKYIRSGTITKVFIPRGNFRIESNSLWFGVDSKPLIKKLVKEGVLKKDGSIDIDKAEEFDKKYDLTDKAN